MKKRLFAGALALLMIIGLLPVSSMLKKPVEANAAESGTYSYTVTASVSQNDKLGDSGFFTAVTDIGVTSKDSDQCLKFKDGKRKINFTIPENKTATVSIKWAQSSGGKGNVKLSGGSTPSTSGEFDTTSKDGYNDFVVEDLKAGEYSITRDTATFLLRSITVTLTDSNPYTVTINDEYASETSSKNTYNEGDKITLSAEGVKQGKTFLYWKNSNGIIVASGSENAIKIIPVYYSDTYTAVYAKEGAKVDYLTPYGGIYETHYYSDGDFDVPTALTKYGSTAVTKNGGWELSYDEVMTKLKNDESFEVNPVYEADTSGSFEITIDTSAIDGNAPETKTYPSNKEVKASVTSENFGRWVDGKGNTLSYNSTYYFLANRDVTVKAVAKDSEEKVGVITYIEYANKTIVFEYTVPNEYTMTFAGVYASTNKSKVEGMTEGSTELPDGVYMLGADESRCGNYKTFRYTLKNSGSDIWYVKPILKYSGSEKPIVDSTVYTMN